MKESLKKAMTASISEVLETMFFMTIDVNENASREIFLKEFPESLFAGKIAFRGALSGHFLLMVPEAILRTMTETFMGLDAADVTEVHLNGTVLEAINMIAGNTFSTLDNTAVFELGIPELIELEPGAGECPEAAPEQLFVLIESVAGTLGLSACFAIA